MNRLIGKVAIVTGASRGIGREIAIALAKEGAGIAIVYSKDDEGANETLKVIDEIGASAIAIKKNVGIFDDTIDIVKKAVSYFGKIDILVNNAGISSYGLFLDTNEQKINDIFNVNLLGALYLTKNTLPYMLEKGGNIINISSIWGEKGAAMEVLYSITKGGINQFTRSLAKEMALSKIRVNAIAPGVIDTRMNSIFSKEEKDELESEIPIGRFGLPEEVGRVAAFLCTEDASYITGQIINVDGGYI
jgi:3-oxoacyl-[acyl-carrier protein] reductase